MKNELIKLISDYLLNGEIFDRSHSQDIRIILRDDQYDINVDVTNEVKTALLKDINALCD